MIGDATSTDKQLMLTEQYIYANESSKVVYCVN